MENSSIARNVHAVIDDVLSSYYWKVTPFFSFLRRFGGRGVNQTQFQLYRDNFFYRTSTTLPSVRKVLAAVEAELPHDRESYRLVLATFDEERGAASGSSHPELLETSHNLHAEKVFGLGSLRLEDAHGSTLLLPEAAQFRNIQAELYGSNSYLTVVGAFLGQESVASHMLRGFYDALFMPYRTKYSGTSFAPIEAYFGGHLDGLEEEHAARARDIALRKCSGPTDLAALRLGMEGILRTQSDLWVALHRTMMELDGA